MRKNRSGDMNMAKNGMKSKKIKRYAAAASAVLLAASVVMTSIVSKTEAAENADTLMGIEKLRSSFSGKDKYFTVLEIVPDVEVGTDGDTAAAALKARGAADIGYLFDGYEPALSSWDPEKFEWVSWKNDLFTKETESDRKDLIEQKKKNLSDYYEAMGLSGENVPVTIMPEEYQEWNGEESKDGFVEVRSDDYEQTGYFALNGSAQSMSYRGSYNLVFERSEQTTSGTLYYKIKEPVWLLNGNETIDPNIPIYFASDRTNFEYVGTWGELQNEGGVVFSTSTNNTAKTKSDSGKTDENDVEADETSGEEDNGQEEDGSDDTEDGSSDTEDGSADDSQGDDDAKDQSDDQSEESDDDASSDSDAQTNKAANRRTSGSTWKKLVNGDAEDGGESKEPTAPETPKTPTTPNVPADPDPVEPSVPTEPAEPSEPADPDEDDTNTDPNEGEDPEEGENPKEGEDPEEGENPGEGEDPETGEDDGNKEDKDKGKEKPNKDELPSRGSWNNTNGSFYIVDFELVKNSELKNTTEALYKVTNISSCAGGQYDFVNVEDIEEGSGLDLKKDVQTYKFPDKALFCKGVFRSNEWFKKYVLNMSEDNLNDFHVKVITLTPSELSALYESEEGIPEFHFLYLNSGERSVISVSQLAAGLEGGNNSPVPGKGPEIVDEDEPDEEDGEGGDETDTDDGSEGGDETDTDGGSGDGDGTDTGGDSGDGDETDTDDGSGGNDDAGETDTDNGSNNSDDTDKTDTDNGQDDEITPVTKSAGRRSSNTSGWKAYVSETDELIDSSDSSGSSSEEGQSETTTEPDEEEQPTVPTTPVEEEQPGTPGNPEEEEQPGSPEDPEEEEQPGASEDPNEEEQPGTPEDPKQEEQQDAPPVRAPYNTATSDLDRVVSNELFKRVSSKALACLVDGHILFDVNEETGKLDVKDDSKVDGSNTEMFRLALMMCQESLEKDHTSVSKDDLIKGVVDDADKNFSTDQVYCRYGYTLSTTAGTTTSGYDSIINDLFFKHTFYREGGEMDPGFQKVLDEIILENLYRASDTSGDFKPLPTDIGQAETVRHILNYQNSRSVEAKKDIKVLEIQPARTDTPQLTKDMIQSWAPGVETVETTVMTTAEFIGKIEKINEIYDLVYIGSSKEHLNISNWITDSGMSVDKEYKGSTVFNDKDMDGLIYYNVGDKRVVDLPMAGLLDSEYPSGNGTGWPYYYNFVRYSGNDITKEKKDALLAFLDGSYPIVVSEDFIEQPVTLFESNDFTGRRGSLQEGEYTTQDLAAQQIYAGTETKGVSSIKIKKGYKVTLYSENNFGGRSIELTENVNVLSGVSTNGFSWNDMCKSIRVEKIETATPVKAIDTDHIDNSSYMYEFVDTAMRKSYTNFFAEDDIDITGSELFKFYLNRPKASLVNFTANGLQEDVYNEAYYIYPMSDGKYYLQYSFSIKNEGAASMATKYNCKLYIDVNADGKFSDSEEVTDIEMSNRATGAAVSAQELYAGVEYTIRREVPSGYTGLLPWKVEVCQVGNDNIYASEQGYTKLQGLDKETIKILQIYRNVAQVIKLDEEIGAPGERHHFYTLVNGGTGPDGVVYKGITDDFELEVTSMSTVEFQQRWYYTAEHGYDENNEESKNNGINMNNYNMLILGFSDMYDDFDGDDQTGPMSAIVEFINSGKSVLLAHDTTSFFNVPIMNGQQLGYPWRNNLNDARGFNNDTRNAATLNKYIRPLVGMDRYAVLKNATVKKGAVLHENDAEWSNLFTTGTEIAYKPKSGRTETVPEAQGYTYALISAKDRKSAGGDEGIPRQQYTKWNLYSSGYNNLDNIVFENKYTNQRFDRVWYWDSSSDDGGDMNVGDKNNGEVDEVNVTQVNTGQLTEYPYKLKDKFEVAITHNQYYQLDYTADDDGDGQSDLVVWYCLGDRNPPDKDPNKTETIYSMSPNDVRNNYYIYNKGNITYTGMGHARKDDWREPYTFEEAKLFINTMIAAYQAGLKPPSIDILESGRANAPKIKVLYRHFDEINLIPLSDAVMETYEKIYFKVTDLNFVKGTRTIETHVFYATNAGTESIDVGTEKIPVNRLEDRFYDAATGIPVAADALDSGGTYYIEVPKSLLDDCETGLDLYFEAKSTIVTFSNNQANLTPEEIKKRTKQTPEVYAKLRVLRSYLFELD